MAKSAAPTDYLQRKRITVDELNGADVEIVEMSALAESRIMAAETPHEQLATLVKYCTTNFAEREVDDILACMRSAAMREIQEAVLDLSGLDTDDEDEAPGKPSETSPAAASNSA